MSTKCRLPWRALGASGDERSPRSSLIARGRQRRAWTHPLTTLSLLSAAALAGCEGQPAPSASRTEPPPLAEHQSEIKNGTVWNPWTQTTQTWTRNVVHVGGCTGTLLDYEWVLSASHCFDIDTVPSSITVSHVLADGSTETAHGAELLFHPQSGAVTGVEETNVDVVLIRLNHPLSPGVASLPLADESMDGLVGQSAFCAGYGAIDTGGACDTSADCNSNQFCKWGVCMTRSDGQLRTATFSIIEDPVNPAIWYRFLVPNVLGQIELPGDSGSSCWNGSGLTGVMKAGNATNYNRQTGAPAFRDWVRSQVTPPVLRDTNIAGAACKGVDGDAFSVTSAAQLWNTTAGSKDLVCPIKRPIGPTVADWVRVPRVWVYDRHPTEDVCCHVQSKNPGGALVSGDEVCSSGSSSSYQTLVLPSVRDTFSFSQASVQCTVPGPSADGQSGVHGLRAQLANR